MSTRAALILALALAAACSDPKPGDETTAPLSSTGLETTIDTPTSSGSTIDETSETSAQTTDTSAQTTDTSAQTTDTSAQTTDTSTGPISATSTGSSSTTGDETTGGTTMTETTGDVGPCEGDAPRVLLATTLGDMVLELDAVNAPVTTANFLSYVEEGFYDGTIFHRVLDGFVIQGGGFTADLQQKPTKPPIALEVGALTHVNGAISMARTNDPNSATSQFFICDGPQAPLDGQYAVFGIVVEGFDVLATISGVPTGGKNGFTDVPVEDVIVTEAKCVP